MFIDFSVKKCFDKYLQKKEVVLKAFKKLICALYFIRKRSLKLRTCLVISI